MHENNAHDSIGIEILNIGFVIFVFLLTASCNNAGTHTESFLLNPVLDSPYHYEVQLSEKISARRTPDMKKSAFIISFNKVSDSIYGFTFRFTSIDTSLLKYLDQQDSIRRRTPNREEIRHRTNYSMAFREASRYLYHGKVDNKGQLLSVKGFNEMKKRISTQLNMDQRDVYSMLHDVTGDPVVEKLLNFLFMSVAGKPVSVDDTWIRNIIDRTRAPLKNSHLVTFKSFKGDTSVLEIQTQISAKTGNGGTLFESGKGSGEWKVNKKTGLPFEWNHLQETEYRTNYDTVVRTVVITGALVRSKEIR